MWANEYKAIEYKTDDASSIALTQNIPGSHIKVYLPSIPYSYIMRLINGTLVRLDDSEKGWEYFLALKHEKINPITYDFWLREDVKFQDGTLFDADSVVENFNFFQKGPFTYTDIHNTLSRVEKIAPFKIRIHLTKPYGMLLNDLARINLYTSDYLKKYAWSNNIVGENTKAPGPYGSGPYILTSGYATGLNQSDKLILKANPYYFEKGKPYIETITIYTKLTSDEVIRNITEEEGKLDIAVIPFDKKTEVVNSPYAKLSTVVSTNNISVHMNLMNPRSILQDESIRQALNQAIDQSQLVKFIYKNEGEISPFLLSSNTFYAKELSSQYIQNPPAFFSEAKLHQLLANLRLKIVTQDRFLSLWRGIEYQLSRYGVSLEYTITSDETYVLNQLLTNRQNIHEWDMLIWGNDDWYGHPWSTFFTLYTHNQWSAINIEPVLDKKLQHFFELESGTQEFQTALNDILKYSYQKAYMLSLPSAHVLLALNKEVSFSPSPVAILKLWEAKLTPYHWSIRGNAPLPQTRKAYIFPQRILHNE